MPPPIELSVVVVSWNTREILRACLAALFRALDGIGAPSEVIVVENGSADGSAAAVRAEFPRARLIANDRNLGYARAANQGLRAARGRYRCLLNSDTVPNAACLARLMAFLDETPRAAGATAQLLDPDGRKQTSFDAFPDLLTELVSKTLARRLWPARYPSKRLALPDATEVDVALGACFMLRASVLEEVGLLDEDYFFFQEDADFCLRARRAGRPVYVVPPATIVHLQGKSKENAPGAAHIEYQRSMYLYFRKNRGRLAYAALRALRPVKLFLDVASTALLVGATLALVRRPRRNLAKYANLFAWHLAGCPAGVGLARSLLREKVPDHEPLEAAPAEHVERVLGRAHDRFAAPVE